MRFANAYFGLNEMGSKIFKKPALKKENGLLTKLIYSIIFTQTGHFKRPYPGKTSFD